MLSECNLKDELGNIEKSCYKFSTRDMEIKKACYYCRVNMDQEKCTLFQIYEQIFPNIELNKNKLLEETNNRKEEIILLQDHINELNIQKEHKEKEIINLDKEIELYNNKTVKIRANDFLRTTIGGENYLFYMDNGYLDITGTNNSIYRITNKGIISKITIKKGFVTRIKDFIALLKISLTDYYQKKEIETLEGQIKATHYPLEDAIAIVYVNIMRDSDRFDRNKGCGQIYINHI